MPRPRNQGRATKADRKAARATMKRLFHDIFTTYPIHLILVVIFIIVSVLANVQGTLFTRTLIDSYITPMIKDGSHDFGPLLGAIRRVAAFYILGIFSTYMYNLLMIYVNQGMLKKMRDAMFTHMETLPIRYFDMHAHGDIMSCYTNDIDTLRQMISQSIPQIINATFTIVSVLISMIYLSPILTVITLGMTAIMIFVTGKAASLSGRFYTQQQSDLGELNGEIEEMMNGQKVVKVFNHEEEAIKDFDKLNDALYKSVSNANSYANILGPINNQLGNVSYVLITVVGGAMAITGFAGLTLGKLASFLTFNRSFNMPISQVSQQINFIVMAMAGAKRIYALLDEKPETDDGYVTLVNAKEESGKLTETPERTGLWAWRHEHQADHTVDYRKLAGDVVMEDVNFGYVPNKQVLYDINLYAKPGQKVAFVGATGAGKTTITNLINRFYDVEDGKIRYDGININKIKKPDLRRSLGIVLQDTHLFTGTVAENIRYGKLDATDEEVRAAAKLANADGFISHLKNGYDTVLKGDGANLSTGF